MLLANGLDDTAGDTGSKKRNIDSISKLFCKLKYPYHRRYGPRYGL